MERMPSLAAAQGQRWNAWQLLRFGSDLLSWMDARCAEHEGQHVRFEFSPATGRVACAVVEGGALPDRLREALGDAAGW